MAKLQQNLLKNIPDNQLDPHVFDVVSGSTAIGPVTIDYSVDLSVPQVTFSVLLNGTNIGGGTLNTQNPSVTVGGSVSGFKASVTLTANFSASNITYALTACVPIIGCANYSGTLYSWA